VKAWLFLILFMRSYFACPQSIDSVLTGDMVSNPPFINDIIKKRVSGVVTYPNGDHVAGAKVTAVTACEGEPCHRVQEVTTSEDGIFHIGPFLDSACMRLRLSAQKDFWLPTGQDVFYDKQIGTTPNVELSETDLRTEIQLGEQGGRVHIRVWDTATQRFIYAQLGVRRLPVAGAKFGSMEIATGRDGSADTLLLPSGTYEFSVKAFACGDQDYFAAAPVRDMVKVEAAQTITKDMWIDVQRIKPVKSYSNPNGSHCVP
jgi:hypothetical protein